MMKWIKGIATFFGVFLLYHLIGSSIFPIDENNILQAPDWYAIVGIVLAASATYFAVKGKKKAENRRTSKRRKYQKNSNNFAIPHQDESRIQVEPIIPPAPVASSVRAENVYLNVDVDDLLYDAVAVVFETNQPSVSMIQRKLSAGYARAAKLIDQMEALGIVSAFIDNKPRSILVTREEATLILHNTSARKQVQIEPSARSTIPPVNTLAAVDMMDGHTFEYWCADLLKKNGFTNIEVTPGSGDQGVDILAVNGGVRFAIQCKCYSSNLGNTPVQEVNAGRQFYHCQVGVVMTNSHFTKSAKELADATGILLWDREKLQEFIQTAGRPV